ACARRFASGRCRRWERSMSSLPRNGAVPAPVRDSVRVMLADDHAVVREGYRRLLELGPGVAVVSECADGESVRAALDGGVAVDVLVLDLSMPGCGGLAVLRRARDAWPQVQVLVFTMHDSP